MVKLLALCNYPDVFMYIYIICHPLWSAQILIVDYLYYHQLYFNIQGFISLPVVVSISARIAGLLGIKVLLVTLLNSARCVREAEGFNKVEVSITHINQHLFQG